MERTVMATMVVMCLGLSGARAAEPKLDSDLECRAISEVDQTGCRCRGLYFESRFGPDEGAVALHLVGRSYVSDPGVTVTSLYERFGAARLDEVARKILETQGEVTFYCPFSAIVAD
jgi:hypothetical protein